MCTRSWQTGYSPPDAILRDVNSNAYCAVQIKVEVICRAKKDSGQLGLGCRAVRVSKLPKEKDC